MKKYFTWIILVTLSLFLNSCAAIGDIFKTGMGVGIGIVVIIVIIILAIMRRSSNK